LFIIFLIFSKRILTLILQYSRNICSEAAYDYLSKPGNTT